MNDSSITGAANQMHQPPLPFPGLQQSLQWHSYRTRNPGLAWVSMQIHEAVTQFRKSLTMVG